MARKTIEVEKLRDAANNILAKSSDDMDRERAAIAVFIEEILFSTDNYKGFQLLGSEYLPAEEQTDDNVLREGHDDTRRRYF